MIGGTVDLDRKGWLQVLKELGPTASIVHSYLVNEAAFRAHDHSVNGLCVRLEEGWAIASSRFIAKALSGRRSKFSEASVRRAMDQLRKRGLIVEVEAQWSKEGDAAHDAGDRRGWATQACKVVKVLQFKDLDGGNKLTRRRVATQAIDGAGDAKENKGSRTEVSSTPPNPPQGGTRRRSTRRRSGVPDDAPHYSTESQRESHDDRFSFEALRDHGPLFNAQPPQISDHDRNSAAEHIQQAGPIPIGKKPRQAYINRIARKGPPVDVIHAVTFCQPEMFEQPPGEAHV